MKYLSLKQIEEAITALRPYNAFFGVTFLAAKRAQLPVGEAIHFRMDAENRRFLELPPMNDCGFRRTRPDRMFVSTID